MHPVLYLYRVTVRRVLSRSRRYIFLVAAIFLVGIAIGFISYQCYPGQVSLMVSEITAKLTRLSETLEGAGTLQAVLLVFWTNLKVVLMCIASGPAFGIAPAAAIFLNGFFIGVAAGHAASRGLNVPLLLGTSVMPHGIFEVPAVILGGVLGMRIGFNILALLRSRQTLRGVIRVLGDTLAILLALVIPLLAAAALIEMTLTRYLVTRVIVPGLGDV
ncbi:MAG TPA: stage II sporulation protein M [Firmicutes bacterium]|nr:stage II sporulation protein M [Bacillota bacterium]